MPVVWVGSKYMSGGQHQCAIHCKAFWAHWRDLRMEVIMELMAVEVKKKRVFSPLKYLAS